MKIEKSHWLDARRCASKAWFGLHSPDQPLSESSRFLFEQGREVALRARGLYPAGVVAGSLERTRHLVAEPAVSVIFDARFEAGPFAASVDILVRGEAGWQILEVRSSLASKPVSRRGEGRDLTGELAYAAMVLREAGVPVAGASVAQLSRQYRFGDSLEQLFEISDKTAAVELRLAETGASRARIAESILSEDRPEARFCSACRKCEYFASHCLGRGLEHTVLEIPGLKSRETKELADLGVVDLALLPPEFPLTDRQQRARECALTGNRYIGPQLAGQLNAMEWPCYYLDFESVMTAFPLYPGHGCHSPVLTQFSLHRRQDWREEATHSDYLADPARDCAREFAEALLSRLGDRGSILVYSEFEGAQIRALAAQFPDLESRLTALSGRIVDLLPIIQRHVYDPAFRGRTTLKKVLPALVHDLSYAGLVIQDGGTAVARFARMATGDITGSEALLVGQQLRDYCRMDTLAMVRLHEVLSDLAGARRAAG